MAEGNGECLDRDTILARLDLAPVAVQVPEWGGKVYVRPMTGNERDEFEEMTEPGHSRRHLRARLCAATVCDSAGELLFTLDDLVRIGAKNAAALDRIFPVAARLSGMTRADVQELEKKL